MNIFKIIGEVFGLVPKAVDAIKSLATAAHAEVKPIPFGRKHFWSHESLRAPITQSACIYCKVMRTVANENEQCPGPIVARVRL